MGLTLAVFETSSVFAALSGALVVGAYSGSRSALDLGQALVVLLGCLVAFYVNDLYDLRIVRSFGQFAPRLVQAGGMAFILVAGGDALLFHGRLPDREFVIGVVVVMSFVGMLRACSYEVMQRAPFLERVLVVGATSLTQKLIETIEAEPSGRYAIVGVVDDAGPATADPGRFPLLGPLANLDKIVAELRPDRIIVGLTERRGRLPVRQLLETRVRGTRVEDAARMYERMTGKLAIESLAPSALVFAEDFEKSWWDVVLGRALSLAVSCVGLIVLAPLFAVIAAAIKLDSRGPVLFVHDRIGLNGRHFNLLKFRTMHPAAGKTSEWVKDNTDRITRVGRWLRRFRLDELPQFINILRGEMNLVGPRPHPVSNFDLFSASIPYYSLRCLVRPGVTGWAQVRHGYANDVAEETEKMRYDLFYIKHLSLGRDLQILFETIKIVLFGRDAVR